MKYKFNPVLDTFGEGFVKTYLRAKSTVREDVLYHLEIDHNLDAPIETWELTQFYKSCSNGVWKDDYLVEIVYKGKQLTDDQRDTMIDLVLEVDYLIFEN